MKNNPMDIVVVCENEEQREHALELAKSAGIAFGEWFSQVDLGNILRVYPDGDWIFFNYNGSAKTILTYDDFIEKYGQPQPDPIAKLTKRLEAVEQRVFGNSEQAQPSLEPNIDIPCIWPEQAAWEDHKKLFAVITAPNQFGNYHRFTDEKGKCFEMPTEVGDKRICIDHLTGKRQLIQVVEVDDEVESNP